jgi:hypothetical protein
VALASYSREWEVGVEAGGIAAEIACPFCGEAVSREKETCPACERRVPEAVRQHGTMAAAVAAQDGTPAPTTAQEVTCPFCGASVSRDDEACFACGRRVPDQVRTYGNMASAVAAEPKPPTVGVVGFWLSIAGIIVPGLGLAGFICCIIGLAMAKSSGRPSGALASIGIALGVLVIVLNIVAYLRLAG